MPSKFRNLIPSEQFAVEKDRYILYINYVCPWAHRAIIVRALKGLEDIVQLVEVDARDPTHGWYFSGHRGPERDPIHGCRWLKELYLRADPYYNGRITIPLMWDKKQDTIVNNESADIIRILFEAFDPLLPPHLREVNKGAAAFIPPHLRTGIDSLNSWVYDTVNNGVYKVGFATSQAAYNEHISRLFQSLDRLEHHLSQAEHYPYLFGQHITEADIRLYTTLVRFDVAYYPLFKCNMRMIRLDYPRLHAWLRRLYWSEGPETNRGAFKSTTHFDVIKRGYSSVAAGNGIVPAGPVPPIMPL
ncbi:glutathione transferase [Cucurbitaria berberidis CBS 394.84]|uniref:Glutathione transferase n=1 Tax=Cucurbitaria berberidis CBS 394.84 TaxID=1168544 RepID=A0A9P4LE92_9PLEO|nr:glutathione transferase [Cucurbitaria berberidis CBS 394.84]KAF1851152.1 glutathione transferase [Cucurbitaria berberidis CBS 394.84]